MKVFTLGTSHGNAEPGRSCSATLLQVGNGYYLLDCAAPVERMMRDKGIEVAAIKAIFVTHLHVDHIATIPEVLKCFACDYEKHRTVDLFMPEQNAIDGLRGWLASIHFGTAQTFMRTHETQEGVIYEDENVKVTAIRTQHMGGDLPSYAYLFEGEGKKLLHTGDLRGDFADYPAITAEEDFDAVVSELTHFSVTNALPRLVASRTKKMIFTHIYPARIERIGQVADQFPFPFFLANDGDEFEV